MHFLQTFVMQDFWKDSEMINTRYCAAAYFCSRCIFFIEIFHCSFSAKGAIMISAKYDYGG